VNVPFCLLYDRCDEASLGSHHNGKVDMPEAANFILYQVNIHIGNRLQGKDNRSQDNVIDRYFLRALTVDLFTTGKCGIHNDIDR